MGEYSIILLPDESTIAAAEQLRYAAMGALSSHDIIALRESTLFYLSLFQLRCEERKLPDLTRALDTVSSNIDSLQFAMNQKMQDTSEAIYWGSEEAHDVLENWHRDIVETANSFRDTSEPFSQTASLDVNTRQQHALHIGRYGIFWPVPENFHPHMTLLYHSVTHTNLGYALDLITAPHTIFKATALALGELDNAGEVRRIHAVIKEFSTVSPQPRDDIAFSI